jgi:hypothetical protein
VPGLEPIGHGDDDQEDDQGTEDGEGHRITS